MLDTIWITLPIVADDTTKLIEKIERSVAYVRADRWLVVEGCLMDPNICRVFIDGADPYTVPLSAHEALNMLAEGVRQTHAQPKTEEPTEPGKP